MTEPWQFALTWFAVVVAVIIYCMLGHVIKSFDNTMISVLCGDEISCERSNFNFNYHQPHLFGLLKSKVLTRPVGWQSVKLLHSLLSGLRYGLSLMLMLIAMTFNPSLFIALIVGAIIGEYMCCDYNIDLIMGVYKPITQYGGISGRIIRGILCIPRTVIGDEQESFINSEKVHEPSRTSASLKSLLWLFPRTISMVLLVITIVWVMEVEGTFGFDSTSVFGWHALCMTLFATVFTNEAVLTYTVPFFPQMVNDRKVLR